MARKRGFRRPLRAAIALGAFAVSAVAPPAPADQATFIVLTEYFTYIPGDVDRPTVDLTITTGSSLSLVNLDPFGAHNIASDDVDPGGSPLFGSGAVNATQATNVDGVEGLPPGDYSFHCEIHFPLMRGLLRVRDLPTAG